MRIIELLLHSCDETQLGQQLEQIKQGTDPRLPHLNLGDGAEVSSELGARRPGGVPEAQLAVCTYAVSESAKDTKTARRLR